MERLTRQEEDVMRWIWQIEPCFIKDILAKYEEPKPPYTTLASIVKNLERKKYVKAKRYGNTYEYRPLIPQEEYKRTGRMLMSADGGRMGALMPPHPNRTNGIRARLAS